VKSSKRTSRNAITIVVRFEDFTTPYLMILGFSGAAFVVLST